MDAPRLSLSIALARAAALASTMRGRGGTSLPGLVALRFSPRLVAQLAAQLGGGTIVVAGTNGKTTTSALTSAALTADGRSILHNREGSNMLRGVATTLARHASLTGKLRDARRLTGLFEVDEAALPQVMEQIRPRIVLLTNLFRDQLDRYGELATIAGTWSVAIARLSPDTTLVLNADDPLIASLASSATGSVLLYGIDRWPEGEESSDRPAASADTLFCPRCGASLGFDSIAYAHLGIYHCPVCGYGRPEPAIRADVAEAGPEGSVMIVRYGDEQVPLHVSLPGRYNAYNALAALAAAVASGISLAVAAGGVAGAPGAFGRAETLQAAGRTVRLFLIKNPTGADQVLHVVAAADPEAHLLLLLSDNAADGHDVSWIWDAQFELLAGWHGQVRCGGTRAEDMALRLKYAGLRTRIELTPGPIPVATEQAMQDMAIGETLIILATYTAMLAARDTLARAGHVTQYWGARR